MKSAKYISDNQRKEAALPHKFEVYKDRKGEWTLFDLNFISSYPRFPQLH